MKIVEFPSCCTAKLVTDFGESNYAEDGPAIVTKKIIDDYLIKAETNIRALGLAVIVVTTNNEQKITNSVLRKRNYKHSKWMRKIQHAGTKVRIWHKPLFD